VGLCVAESQQRLLGDKSDGSRARPHHRIALYAENEDGDEGEQITPESDPLLPFSTRWTCGSCHNYALVSRGWHFNAGDPNVASGRPGEPWILFDGQTGTQIPVSYRAWPGTYKPQRLGLSDRQFVRIFGRHMPGGGVGERPAKEAAEIARQYISGKLEINCLSCHDGDPEHNQGQYAIQVVRENYRWAAAATCWFATVKGSARDMDDMYDPFMPEEPMNPKKVPPTIQYRKEAFDEKGQVFFDIRREVPSDRCYFCHSNLYLKEPETEKWTSDEDIHLTAGLECVDCHRNGIEHDIVRGYAGEASDSNNPLVEVSTCEGCHLGAGDSGEGAGRLGAPVPRHAGIPPVHFERLSCTACHSGPLPEDKAVLTKTSRSHRLGTIGVNKANEMIPHILAPVFAKGADGKIGPHRLVWPAFWGMQGDPNEGISPLPFDTVTTLVAELLKDLEVPRNGDWPALTEEHVKAVLTELQKNTSVEGKPVYVSGGVVYRLGDDGQLVTEEGHPAAEPYLWPIAHEVRPAAQALGAGNCHDCHSTEARFFFGSVPVDSAVPTLRQRSRTMVEFEGLNPRYVWAFAFSFVFRPWLKVIALACCGVIAIVLLLYALRALASVVRVVA